MSGEAKAWFSKAGVKFLKDLARHNEREWFNERKSVYEAEVKAPMLAVIAAVNEQMLEFAPEYVRDPAKTMFRIYRDTRFSKDKKPYKDHAGAWWARRGLEKTSGGGFYFHVSGTEVFVAAGVYLPQPEQLLAIRRHLLERHEEFRRLAGAPELAAAGMVAMEPAATTRVPKGFPVEHAAMDLIKQRQWGLRAVLPVEVAMSAGLVDEVAKRFHLGSGLVGLLNEPLVGVGERERVVW